MELHDRAAPFPDEEPDLPEPPRCGLCELAPPDVFDPVIEAYKKDVDRTLLIENLKLTPDERSQKFLRFMEMVYEVRRAGERFRASQSQNE